jgi:hypothetical protein
MRADECRPETHPLKSRRAPTMTPSRWHLRVKMHHERLTPQSIYAILPLCRHICDICPENVLCSTPTHHSDPATSEPLSDERILAHMGQDRDV